MWRILAMFHPSHWIHIKILKFLIYSLFLWTILLIPFFSVPYLSLTYLEIVSKLPEIIPNSTKFSKVATPPHETVSAFANSCHCVSELIISISNLLPNTTDFRWFIDTHLTLSIGSVVFSLFQYAFVKSLSSNF